MTDEVFRVGGKEEGNIYRYGKRYAFTVDLLEAIFVVHALNAAMRDRSDEVLSEDGVFVLRHGKIVSPEMGEGDWFDWLEANQLNRVDWALQHGGYTIRRRGSHGGICFTRGCRGAAKAVSPYEVYATKDYSVRYRCDDCVAMIGRVVTPAYTHYANARADAIELLELDVCQLRLRGGE